MARKKRGGKKGKSKQRAAPKRNNAGAAAMRIAKGAVPVPDCVREWVDLVSNPYRTPDRVCMPLPPAMPAASVTVWVKGVFVTGTTPEKGYVAVNTRQMTTSDLSGVVYTSSAYAGTTIAASGTGIASGYSNSPYPEADYGDDPAVADMQSRIVAAGLRVRNITAVVDRGGRLQLLAEPDHKTLLGSDYTDLTAYDCSESGNTDGNWSSVEWVPARSSDSSYSSVPTGNYTMAAMAAAPAGKPQSYEYEAWTHFQVIGAKARGKQRVKVDVVGGNTAWEALADAASKRGRIMAKSVYENIRDRVYDAATRMVTGALNPYPGLLIKEHGEL